MLIFESFYDDFMTLNYEKVWSQISSHKIHLFKLVMSLITCFYVWRAVKMFYFVELLQVTVVRYINNRLSALVIGCYFYLRS